MNFDNMDGLNEGVIDSVELCAFDDSVEGIYEGILWLTLNNFWALLKCWED